MSNKLFNYFRNSIRELKKVNWPTKKQTISHTLLVVGISLGMALFLGIVDFILTKVLQLVI
ncbi:preprotein translocase subunit SecE [Candidatus Parcubacteria bacterium 4484_255]|nr:MAG: preprotein translocase subunit SecE [Candidatus Parcubacteria bacterium 4484_255]